MTQKHLGVVRLGHMNVDLFVLPETSGGEFYFTPDDKSLPRIKIGLRYARWDEVVSTLLHEAMETAFNAQDLGYTHCGKLNYDSDDRLFVMDHSRFSRACSMAALFLVDALPKIATEWKKNRRKKP